MSAHTVAAVAYCEYADVLAERNAILDASGVAILRLDQAGNCVFLNAAAEDLFGWNLRR